MIHMESIIFFLDIDECASKTDNCSTQAICNNTVGSFNCSCKPGFAGNGTSCAGNYNIPAWNVTLYSYYFFSIEKCSNNNHDILFDFGLPS